MSTVTAPVNEKIVERFKALVEKDKLAHAYLFTGPRHVGKMETALAVAKHLSTSIDTHVFETEYGNTLKMEMVRELLGQIKLRPFEAERKIFILRNADGLTPEASNSLLKTLEEPSKDSLLILTTSMPENILETIRSRCHTVPFLNFSPEEAEGQLIQAHAATAEEAHFLSRFANGNTAVAFQLAADGFVKRKNAWLDEYLFGKNIDAFIKAELTDKETQKMFLDVLLGWVRDAMLLKCRVDEIRLMHADRAEEVEDFANQFDFPSLVLVHKQILKTYQLLNDNLNIKMSLLIIGEMFHG